MKQYLLSIYQPDGDPPPAGVLAEIMRDVRAVAAEWEARRPGARRPVATAMPLDPTETCKECGYTFPAGASRCPSCEAPATRVSARDDSGRIRDLP